MRQTFHILRKDVRFLWAPILLVLALTTLGAWLHSLDPWRLAIGNVRGDSTIEIGPVILGFAWWYLIAAAIFKESLVGDRQFWITRPYRWQSLIAAKALLILAVINLPYLLSDVAILWAHGLTPSIPTLLWRQLAITCSNVLPAAALAAISRNLSQMAVTVLVGLLLLLFVTGSGSRHGMPDWFLPLVIGMLAMTAAAVCLCQYASRNTWPARVLLASGVGLANLAMLIPTTDAAPSLLSAASEPAAVRLVHLAGGKTTGATADRFSVQIEGLPPGTWAAPEVPEVVIDGRVVQEGVEWHWDWGSPNLVATINPQLTNAEPVDLQVSMWITIYRTLGSATVMPDGLPHKLGGIGMCSVGPMDGLGKPYLECQSASPPTAQVLVNGVGVLGDRSYYFGAMFGISPIFEVSAEMRTPVTGPLHLQTVQKVAQISRDLVIKNVVLRHGTAKP